MDSGTITTTQEAGNEGADRRRAAERTVTADGAVADALAIGPDSSAAERTIDITTVGRRTDIPPKGVFSIVTGLGDVVGTAITCHPDVAKISFTGSTAVGKIIFGESAETLKRVTLELGGKSPSIILDDADLEKAVAGALQAGFVNSSQACVADTRILVPESRLDEALAIATAQMDDFPAGDPRDPATVISPMVSQRQWERVQSYIRRGVEPISPFGGFKQSGIGREYRAYGLEGYLEPRAVME
jgi:aldehyde dehydrogenase (NAD+)